MQRFADCCRQIHDQLASCTVRGITVTTFGVDGALVDEKGALLYPIISWKCPRTAAVMEKISQYMPARQLQRIAGVGAFAFNTLYKLVWLKENPQLLAQACWLFISSLINHRLTGEFTTDLTMAGTSQMLDLRQRDFSAPILQATGLPRRLFPRLVEAGQPIGALLPEAAALLGLPSGSRLSRPGMTSSLCLAPAPGRMSRCSPPGLGDPDGTQRAVDTSLLCDYSGSTCELDSQPGRYNPGMQWLASGVLEWVRKLLWSADTPWQTLIDEAQAIPPGAGASGCSATCSPASTPAGGRHAQHHPRPFYRAALEGLSDQLAQHLQTGKNRPLQGERAAAGGRRQPRYGTRSRPTDSGYRSKSSTMPKPPWPARRCLAGMAWASSLRQNRPERRSRTATAISGRKLNLN